MSSYFIVHLRSALSPEGLTDAHADDALFLNARGRPSTLARAARLESADLAAALLEACRQPLVLRHGDVVLSVRKVDDPEADAARIAADSDATRAWLESQQHLANAASD